MSPYTQIKSAIVTGKFKPGARLTEEGLAEELKISRTPIRQVIQRLEYEGLVTPLKRGVVVREFTQKDIKQVYNLRALLEGYAASEAALNHTESDIEKMTEYNREYKDAVDVYKKNNSNDLDAIFEANKKFHDTLLAASKNDYLKFHIEKVVVLPLVFRSFYWYNNQQLIRSHEIHVSIIEAVKMKDFNRAKVAIQEHVYQARDHVLNHLKQIESVISESEGDNQ